jgi:HAD superfamily hydrolase (TIGR01458 family)
MTFKGVLLDIAGVIWDGDKLILGAVEAVAELRAANLPFRLVTNTTRRPKRALIDQLHEFGFAMTPGDVFTGTEAVVTYLRTHNLTPYLVVHPGLDGEFADLVGETPNAVVVGDAADRFTYGRLNAAFRLLLTGAPLLAIATNRYFKDFDGLSLDAGPFIAALEYAAQVEANVFGKPEPSFFAAVLADLGTAPDETVMIGDDVEADVNGALAVGLQAILVRTGKYRARDELRMNEGGRSAATVREAVTMVLAG